MKKPTKRFSHKLTGKHVESSTPHLTTTGRPYGIRVEGMAVSTKFSPDVLNVIFRAWDSKTDEGYLSLVNIREDKKIQIVQDEKRKGVTVFISDRKMGFWERIKRLLK